MDPLDFRVALECADVIKAAGESVSIDRFVFDQPGDEIAGSVRDVSFRQVLADQRQGVCPVGIDCWNCKVGFGMLGFLFEGDNFIVLIQLHDAKPFESLAIVQLAGTDAVGLDLPEEGNELGKFEIKKVVSGQDDDVIVDVVFFYGQVEVGDCAKAVIVAGSAVV